MEYHTKHSMTLHSHPSKLQLALGISGGSGEFQWFQMKPPFGLCLKDLINNLAN